jgi:hypothetical protein
VHGRWVHGGSLPPQVEGVIRAYISLSISGISWARQYSGRGRSGAVIVRVKWWGDTGSGVRLRPPVAGAPHSRAQEVVDEVGAGVGGCDLRFPVRCGATKLGHYLADARQLVLDVVAVGSGTHRTLGRVRLGFLRPVPRAGPLVPAGDFEIQDPTLTTIGTLTASLDIEPVLRSEGSSGGSSAALFHKQSSDNYSD